MNSIEIREASSAEHSVSIWLHGRLHGQRRIARPRRMVYRPLEYVLGFRPQIQSKGKSTLDLGHYVIREFAEPAFKPHHRQGA